MHPNWKVLDTIVTIQNRWVEFIGESIIDEEGQKLTYWRVNRPDSIIILPIFKKQFLLPKPLYRHGIREITLDFPGGRRENSISCEENAYKIIDRELGLRQSHVQILNRVNPESWPVDSSFSSQRVHVYEAVIYEDVQLNMNRIAEVVPADRPGIRNILERLKCIQCRCALLEWSWHNII